jgi:hypothetical protein
VTDEASLCTAPPTSQMFTAPETSAYIQDDRVRKGRREDPNIILRSAGYIAIKYKSVHPTAIYSFALGLLDASVAAAAEITTVPRSFVLVTRRTLRSGGNESRYDDVAHQI